MVEAIYAVWILEGVDFLVMELIPGKSLKEIIIQGPMAEKQIQRLGTQLADGLASAHRHNVVRRDLKPANIMVTSDGRLKSRHSNGCCA